MIKSINEIKKKITPTLKERGVIEAKSFSCEPKIGFWTNGKELD